MTKIGDMFSYAALSRADSRHRSAVQLRSECIMQGGRYREPVEGDIGYLYGRVVSLKKVRWALHQRVQWHEQWLRYGQEVLKEVTAAVNAAQQEEKV